MKADAILTAIRTEFETNTELFALRNVQKLVIVLHLAKGTGEIRAIDVEPSTKREILR